MSAATILGCRPEIAESVATAAHNKHDAGWSVEAIAEYLRQMNPAITPGLVRQLLELPR